MQTNLSITFYGSNPNTEEYPNSEDINNALTGIIEQYGVTIQSQGLSVDDNSWTLNYSCFIHNLSDLLTAIRAYIKFGTNQLMFDVSTYYKWEAGD